MRRIADFNFAVAGTGHPVFAWLLLLAGGVASAMMADKYIDADHENESLVRQAGRLERKAKPPVASRTSVAQKSALAGRREVAPFPWDTALREIELAVDSRVALLNLDTEAVARRTRIDAEARNIDDALGFADRLRASPVVTRVLLLAHETKKAPVGAVIGFTLQIDWDIE
jgi:hypothetical protein